MIVVKTETFEMVSRHIRGTIYFECGETVFPDENWDDFVVIIQGWWLRIAREYIDLPSDSSFSAKLLFMDGRFEVWISVNLLNGWGWKLEFIKPQNKNYIIVCEINWIQPDHVLVSMEQAASQTIEKCQQLSWSSSDLDELIKQRDLTRIKLVELKTND
ncbi:MAG: hypothetical protein H7Y09_03260 [Chitinophagaceae bacterium]|nr:hypothetical protein [Anaerolineae bacterium]